MPVYLVGPRACGKTTVGRLLARRLNVAFEDTDALVRERSGRTVAEIVADEGWEGFRERESAALREGRAGVIATGGGMVLRRENREFMREAGTICFLSAPLDVLCARLAADTACAAAGQRPLLTGSGEDAAREMARVLAERGPLYARSAHCTVDASRPPEEVCAEILRKVRGV
ncbi:MAG: shikimate kinase AroL [Desulfovibrio sp.]|jgi:shikimate kinase|nr:shikimate kinase AroL [Desulfovibrio sp.]